MQSSPIIESPGLVQSPRSATGRASGLYPAILKSVSGRYLGYSVQVISLMILARLFTPKEFGIVASVQVFYAFFQMFADVGFGPALINVRSLSRGEIGGVFLTTTGLGVLLAMVLCAFSVPLERFYSLPAVSKVIPFACGALFFYAAAVVPTAALNREMRFLRIAQATVIADALSTLVAITLRLYMDPVMALASKMLISGASQFTVLYLFSSQTEFGRPLFSFEFRALREIWWFSKHQFSFSLVNYFSRNLDNILVGHVIGAVALGVYDKAYQLMKYPLSLLTFAMAPAIQPALRKHSADPRYVEKIHREFVHKLAWLGVAAGLTVAIAAPWIVKLLLGPHWAPVTPIIRELALSIPTQVVLSTSGSFFQSMNRPDLLFLCGSLSAVTLVLAIVFGVYSKDLVLMSWLISVAIDINFAQCYLILYKRVFVTSPSVLFGALRIQIALTIAALLLGSPFVLRSIKVY